MVIKQLPVVLTVTKGWGTGTAKLWQPYPVFKRFSYFSVMCVCLHVCTEPYACLVPTETRKGCWIP